MLSRSRLYRQDINHLPRFQRIVHISFLLVRARKFAKNSKRNTAVFVFVIKRFYKRFDKRFDKRLLKQLPKRFRKWFTKRKKFGATVHALFIFRTFGHPFII